MRPPTAIWRGVLVTTLVFAISVLVMVALDSLPKGKAASKPEARSERLLEPKEVQGVPCTTRVWYQPDGKLKSCVLARETAFGTLTLPAGSQVYFDAELRPATVFLPGDTVIEGHLCIGEGHDAMTVFHPNGRLKFCNLRNPETIDGIPCQKSTAWIWMTHHGAATTFHDNGKLSNCLLFADVTIEGQTFKKGKHISLDREGKVVARRGPH
jgi:hypothetical protein